MSKTILVVDDEKDIRISLTGILEDEGYQVVTAASGIEALEKLREDLPDLVLLDIWMPGMDGLETLEKIKKLIVHITVIMISGHGTIETAVRATKLGAFDFIEKPLSLEKVLISVANALQLQKLKVENAELKRSASADYELIGETPEIITVREQIKRVIQAGFKGPQIAVVDADELRLTRQHPRQLLGIVQFDQHLQADHLRLTVQRR